MDLTKDQFYVLVAALAATGSATQTHQPHAVVKRANEIAKALADDLFPDETADRRTRERGQRSDEDNAQLDAEAARIDEAAKQRIARRGG